MARTRRKVAGRLWGPANGPGWGGPARGNSGYAELQPGTEIYKLARDPENIARKAAIRERMKATLVWLADNSRYDMVRMKAAEAYLNREEGMPVARNVNLTAQAPRDFDFSTWPDDKLRELNKLLRGDSSDQDSKNDVPLLGSERSEPSADD